MTIEFYPPPEETRRLNLERQRRAARRHPALAKEEPWLLDLPPLLLRTHALEETRKWLKATLEGEPGSRLLLLLRHPDHPGGTGRGKTLAMAAAYQGLEQMALRLASDRARPREPVLYLRARDLRRVEEQKRPDVLSRCASAFGLVLDEVGTEPGGPGFRGWPSEDLARDVADMLEARADRGRRTVIGSNATLKELADRYAQRWLSRYGPHGNATRWAIACEGPDLRVEGVPPLPPERRDVEPDPEVCAEAGSKAMAMLEQAVPGLARERTATLSQLDRADHEALRRSMEAAHLHAIVTARSFQGDQYATKLLEEARRAAG